MDLKLKNKKVLISGSSKGIGLSIAKKFIKEGAKVVINSRNKYDLNAVALSIGNCHSVAEDVSIPAGAMNATIRAAEMLGGIDILVCNVGSGSSVPPGHESYNEWQRVFSVNFFTATNLIEASLKYLARSQGSVVCISSICGAERIPGAPVTYSVAKSALNTYVKSIAAPLAERGIRINSVAPGNINFDGSIWSEKMAQDADSVQEMLQNDVPLRKLGSPDDVAGLVVWLASDVSNFVTGTVMTTDGGQSRS